MMFDAQSKAKGHIRMKQNVFLPQVKILIHNLHIPQLRIEEIFGKIFLPKLSSVLVIVTWQRCCPSSYLLCFGEYTFLVLFFLKSKQAHAQKSHTQHVHIDNTCFILYVFWRDSPKLLLCAEKQLKQQKKIISNNENHEEQQMKKCSNDTQKI